MPRAKTASNAILYYESGQDYTAMAALTDSGDLTIFNAAAGYWSGASGKEPVVRPNGLLTGGAITPHATEETVTIAALTCWLAGVATSVNAGTLLATRGVGTGSGLDGYVITSLTITSLGVLAAIAGTEGDEFSTTRGAAGGPPWIPTGSIEIGQVRFAGSVVSAVVTAAEIYTVEGTHRELALQPLWDESWFAGTVTFLSALPEIHSDDAGVTSSAKKVYAEYYTPIDAEVPNASDFVPPENSHSVSSEQVYGATIGSSSTSLGQGSFVTRFQSGVSDTILAKQDDVCWFKFYPDRLKTEYVACQGKLGMGRTFPAGTNIQAACTISATEKASNVTT